MTSLRFIQQLRRKLSVRIVVALAVAVLGGLVLPRLLKKCSKAKP